jgi:hypothetical protein
MAEDRLAEIAKLLLEKTKAGDLSWEKTSKKGEFQVPFARYVILLRGSSDFPNLLLTDQDGDIVEDLSSSKAMNYPGYQTFEELKQLYEAARRRALGADEALDEILKTLRSPGEKK